mgnify:CR=1 FL=1
MGIADILDETVELYRSSFVLLVGMAAVVYVPFFVVDGLVKGFRQPTEASELPGYLGAAVLELVILLLVGTFVTGAMTFAISERYLGRQTSIGACLGRMLRPGVFFPFLGAVMLKYVLVFLPVMVAAAMIGIVAAVSISSGTAATAAVLLLGLPLILGALVLLVYMLVRLALVEPCFILEMSGVRRAIGRSWALVRGYMLKTLAVLAIATAVTWLVQAVLTAPTQAMIALRPEGAPDPSRLLIAVHLTLSTVTSALFMPVISIVTILLYYDIRIRREGFDLEILAQELDARARQAALLTPALPEEHLPKPGGEVPQ